MNFSRCLATAVCLSVFTVDAFANLYTVDYSTRTYSLNGKGEIRFQAGNQRQVIDLAAQNASLNAKTLALVYDTVNDALEVVRKADGSIVSTFMTFSNGITIYSAGETRAYRQTFLTLSGTDGVGGSVDGPIRIAYDGKANIIAYDWAGDFQYSIPGNQNTPNRVVHGRFILKHELKVKATP